MYKITVPSLGLLYYQDMVSYVKYQEKNNLMLLCNKEEAQGIVSIDGSTIYQFNSEDQLKETYDICTIEEVQVSDTINTINQNTIENSEKQQADIDYLLLLMEV